MIAGYPSVVGEVETLHALLAGASIARYGDGELKMCRDIVPPVGIKSQQGDAALSARLRDILRDSGACLVGIPNIHEVVRQHVSDQKVEHWARYVSYRKYLGDRPYYSSFIRLGAVDQHRGVLGRLRVALARSGCHRRSRQREVLDDR
jgi:hypothetical protein